MASIDIDIYGNENPDGTPIEHTGDAAIKNAFVAWITSRKGDYIREPTLGGLFDTIPFRNFNADKIELLRFKIKNAINNEFFPNIRLHGVDAVINKQKRILEIYVLYAIEGGDNQQHEVKVYIKLPKDINLPRHEEITYTGENLRNFCLVVKDNMSGKKLLFDRELEKYVWGRYIFVKFTDSDPYYSEIINICNNT